MIAKLLLPIVALGMASYAAVYVVVGSPSASSPTFPAEPVTAPFSNAVCGTGIVEPESENIAVGSTRAGTAAEVCVKVNQAVLIGDPLVRLDDRELRAQLKIQEAAVVIAEEQLARLVSLPRLEELPAKQLKVQEFRVQLEYQSIEFNRMRGLVEKGALAETEFESTRRMLNVAQAQLEAAEADYSLLKAGAWEPDLALAKAELAMARAELAKAQCDVEHLTVRALTDGRILKVNIRPGEYVATPSLKPIFLMGSTDQLHVRVNVDERDIARVRSGAPAKASTRGASGKWLDLTFVRTEPCVVAKSELNGDPREQVDTRVLQIICVLKPSDQMPFIGQELDVFFEVAD